MWITLERTRRGLTLTCIVLLASCLSLAPAAYSEEAADDGPLSTPSKAYDALEAAVDAQDLEAYKKLWSTVLLERVQYDFYISEGLLSGKEDFEKVPKSEATINGAEASISKTYDMEKVITTYSFLFLKEDGRWMYNGFDTSSRSK